MHEDLKGVRQNRHAILIVNGGCGIFQGHIRRDRMLHPQRQYVPVAAADFETRHNIKGILVAVSISPQAGINDIVIGDGDDIQMGMFGDVVEHLVNGRKAVAIRRVDVHICHTCPLLVCVHVRFLIYA